MSLLPPVVVFKPGEVVRLFIPALGYVLAYQLRAAVVYALIQPADIKDTVENVVACDYPAVIRYLSRQAVPAELGIILKKVAPVVRCFAREGQLFGNYVEKRAFPAAVVAAEYRDIGKFKLRDASSGEKQERIFV